VADQSPLAEVFTVISSHYDDGIVQKFDRFIYYLPYHVIDVRDERVV
jgi:hypothetical protein